MQTGGRQNGGLCSTCGVQNGGSNFYKPAHYIPGPIVGNAWGANVRDWPSENGIGGDRNYLANNLYNKYDPQTMMLLGGTKRTKLNKKSRKNKRGGQGLIPQPLVNLTRDLSYNLGSAYNALNGYSSPVNPSPYMDQIPKAKMIIV